MTLWQTLRYVCLALAMGLTSLVVTALAYGPSAPSEQTKDPTPTAEPTTTAAEPSTSTHQAEVSPLVDALIARQVAIAVSQPDGAAGQQDVPDPRPAKVYISLYDSQKAAVENLLMNQNVACSDFLEFTYTSATDCGGGCTTLEADVPVSLLPALAQHPGVFTIRTLPQYQYHEELDPNLNLIVARHDAGLVTEAEALPSPCFPVGVNGSY